MGSQGAHRRTDARARSISHARFPLLEDGAVAQKASAYSTVSLISLLLGAAGIRTHARTGIESGHASSVYIPTYLQYMYKYAGIVHHEATPVPSAISYLGATRTCTVDHLDLAWLKSLCQQQQPRAAQDQPLITLQVGRRQSSVLLPASWLLSSCCLPVGLDLVDMLASSRRD